MVPFITFNLFNAIHDNAEFARKQREEQFQANMRMQQALANSACENVTHSNELRERLIAHS